MQQNLPRKIHKPQSQTTNQNLNYENVPKQQRHPQHLTHSKHKPKHHPISFKKTKTAQTNINPKYTNLTQSLEIRLEMDEMWGRVYCKKTPCLLRHAINHNTVEIIGYVFGTKEQEVLQKLSLNISVKCGNHSSIFRR